MIDDCLVNETAGIGLYSETGLHAALKRHYAVPGARLEVRLAGRVVDVVKADELVEIQTRNLAAIQDKILDLACLSPVRVVLPVVRQRLISRVGQAGPPRLSGQRRSLFNMFDELIHAPLLVGSPNVRFDILLVRVREQRAPAVKPVRGRRRDRVLSRQLDAILESRSFNSRADWLDLLPPAEGHTSASLATALAISRDQARRFLYTYNKAGLIEHSGCLGRAKLYILKQ